MRPLLSSDGLAPLSFQRRAIVAIGLVVVAILGLTVWQAAVLGRRAALLELNDVATAALTLQKSALESELARRRSVPFVLAYDADIIHVVRNPGDQPKVDALNRKLTEIAQSVDAAVLYVMDRHGTTLASSNWQSDLSFIGHNFAFRPYFQEALAHGKGEFFALGSVSQQPGFYVARAIPATGDPVAVVVMKIQFDQIEAAWGRGTSQVFVTDEHGVIVLSGKPAWRFRTLETLSSGTAEALRQSRQFGHADLRALPLRSVEARPPITLVSVNGAAPDDNDAMPYLKVSTPVQSTSWFVHTLTPVEPTVRNRATLIALNAGLLSFVAIAIALLVWNRRLSARTRLLEGARVREDLEHRVRDRTAQLTDSTRRLENEIEERERVQTILRQALEKLVHAEKLAALGQMAAGICHEVNQPLAALRSYADNALILQQRGRDSEVSGNLVSIASLTDRIGQIMQHLRAFARKASGKNEPVSIAAAVAGSLALMAHRLRSDGIKIIEDMPKQDILVWGEQIRIEQVLINLLQNAADATRRRDSPTIQIRVHRDDNVIVVSVEDNGCGVPTHQLPSLFSAFFTTKDEGSGLGLGLYISRGIVEEFGGKLTAVPITEGGIKFSFTLCAVWDDHAEARYEGALVVS
jgi:two-component system C4-dicarboxylate transport sensor histidine kinase DctB